MDATYEKDDDHEKAAFDSACIKLHELLEELPGLQTDNVRNVETDNALLQRKNKEKEAETETLKAEVKKVEMEKENMKIKASLGGTIVPLAALGALACIPLGATDNALLQQRIKEKERLALSAVAAAVAAAALADWSSLTLLGGGATLAAKAMGNAAGKLNLYYSIH